jgi:hypothetical protein
MLMPMHTCLNMHGEKREQAGVHYVFLHAHAMISNILFLPTTSHAQRLHGSYLPFSVSGSMPLGVLPDHPGLREHVSL